MPRSRKQSIDSAIGLFVMAVVSWAFEHVQSLCLPRAHLPKIGFTFSRNRKFEKVKARRKGPFCSFWCRFFLFLVFATRYYF